jgi:condensin-2 complex subunit D3
MIYGETTTDLPSRPDKKILDYFFGYLKSAVDGKISFSFQLDTPRKINLTVTLLTRFAIRDYELAASLSPFLGKLLCQKIPITIIENVMLSLNNLCKKHTATVEPIMKDIVYQLKSPNDEIRICALENLYDLILQDYIKLRGQVLLHILASLVDKNENVTLKATALILNYAYDKNQNLLHTCFIESVFVLNGYFQFEDFGVFPASELDNKSTILMGEHKRDYRYELYDFFCKNIHEMNEVHLLMLFKYVLTILEKFKKKKLVKNRYGVQAFQDLLHCFKLICEKREESRSKIEKTSDNADDDDMDDDLPVEQVIEAAVAKKSTKINKNLPTMKDAIQLIEKVILVYPQFYDCMKSYDKSLEPGLNLLSLAIAKNFKNLVQYAKPADFWDQFRKKTAGPSTRKRPRRKSKDSQVADDLDLD